MIESEPLVVDAAKSVRGEDGGEKFERASVNVLGLIAGRMLH